MISASGDGAWLAAFFRLCGLHSVRGSSSWRGKAALKALVAKAAQGHDIAITPDGPRGPCYDFKPGALLAARLAKAPVVLLGMRFSRAWRLSSWDGLYLPRPFSRVRVTGQVMPAGAPDNTPETCAAAMAALNPDADAQPGSPAAPDKAL